MTTTTGSEITLQLGQYRLRRKLAPCPSPTACQASYEAWLVTDRNGQLWALKRLYTGSDRIWRRGEQDEAISRLQQEADALAQFDGDRNIIHLVYQNHDPLFLVTELLDTSPVQLRIGGWASRDVARFGSGICRALATIHDAGWVHRDVKRENTGLTAQGETALMDFSSVWPLGEPPEGLEDGSGTRRIVGTPTSLAPEQLLGQQLTGATDIFALGVAFFQLLTCRSPFKVDRTCSIVTGVHILHDEPNWSDNLPPEHPWRPLLERMLAKDPAERPSAAGVGRKLLGLDPSLDPTLL